MPMSINPTADNRTSNRNGLVALCIRNPLIVAVLTAVVVAVGVDSARSLPVDAVPDITNLQVQVLSSAPALGPLDVEQTVTAPIEAALAGLPGVDEIRSLSRAGLSAITVVFDEGTPLLLARQLVGERVAAVRNDLGEDIDIELGPLSTGLGEVLQFEVHSETPCPQAAGAAAAANTATTTATTTTSATACHSLMELRGLLDGPIATELRSVRGVAEINAFGGELMTFEVALEAQRLTAFGIEVGAVFQALQDEHATAGGGSIARAGEQWLVRGEGRFFDVNDVADVVVARRGEQPVRVADLGVVHEAPLLRHGAVTRDGRGEVVTGIVMMLVGENGGDVVGRVKDRLASLAPSLPEGVTIDVFYDRSVLVERTIHTVAKNLIEGAIFVVLVLFVMLGSGRAGVVVAVAIPLAMLCAFIGMRALGLSGNLMSLGALDFGVVVDGSVIVVEAAVVAFAAAARKKGSTLSYAEAGAVVVDTSRSLQRSTLYGGAILALVYVPVLTLRGVEGAMFRPMAWTVLFALLGAVLVSFTVVPVLTAAALRNAHHEQEPRIVRALRRAYQPVLRASVARPGRVVAVVGIAVVVAVVLVTRLGAAFMPRLDEGALAIQLMRLPSVSLDESIAGSTRFEAMTQTFSEVETTICKTGRAEVATDPMGVELSDCFVMLHPVSSWTSGRSPAQLVDDLQAAALKQVPDLGLSFSQPIELRMAELISGSRADVAITIAGDDLADLEVTSLAVQAAVARVSGADDVRGEALTGVPAVDIRVDRAAAGIADVSTKQILQTIDAIGGHVVGEVRRGQQRIPVQVRWSLNDRADIDELVSLPVGSERTLGDVAHVAVVDAPAVVNRVDLRRRTVVEVNVRGRDLAGFVAEAQAAVSQVPLTPGTVIRWGGQVEQLEAASARLAVAVPFALALIFMLLLLACGDAATAVTVFLNVPCAAVGGVVALWVRGIELSISAGVGFIAVFGVAVLNGVVLMNTINARRAAGHDGDNDSENENDNENENENENGNGNRNDVDSIVIAGSNQRLRAVVMTAAVAVLGFVPMALSSTAGAEVQRPLATVVIGGLLTSTLLTLLVLPAVTAWRWRRSTRI